MDFFYEVDLVCQINTSSDGKTFGQILNSMMASASNPNGAIPAS